MDGQQHTGLWEAVRNFLFGIFNKEFLIFLFFLFVSGAFWLVMALNEDCERELKIPVRLEGVPKKVIVTDASTDSLRVVVRDKGYMLVPFVYGDRLHPIVLSFKACDKGNGYAVATQAELLRQIRQQLFKSTVVASLKPDRVEYTYNHGDSKRVPVRLKGKISPGESHYIASIVFEPEYITIYASQEKLDSIKSVYTETIRLDNLVDTVEREVALGRMKGVKMDPSVVKVSFMPDVLTEESVEVNITAENMPEGKILRTFPTKVRVFFTTGASMFRNIRAEQFSVVANYDDIATHPSEKCKLELKAKPQGVRNARLEVDAVNYLIEAQ